MLCLIIAILCFAFDRITKMVVAKNFLQGESIPVIKNVFHLTYVKNQGAAFSILYGKTVFLIIITLVIVIGIVIYLIAKKPKDKLLLFAVSLILSGAAGNLTDRIQGGGVIDFLDFRFINFPVFNFADCFVVIGAVLLCIYEIKSSRLENGKNGK